MEPIRPRLTRLFTEFIRSEQASGVILMTCTVISIVIANSPLGKGFLDFWQLKAGFEFSGLQLKFSLGHWINDGLMAFFFLLIGLEIERELYVGELSKLKHVALPVFAAIGGIVMPALIHFLFNRGTETQGGAGIPMSTDIAFALGVLALLGNKIPVPIKIFLTALAIIDDLAAIIIIAFFYVGTFSPLYLILALGIFAGLLVLNRIGIGAGLFVGKPLGIVLFALAAIKLRLAQLHKEVSWRHIIGAGFLSGVGFTMSIFITLLAFDNPQIVQNSKIAIMFSSLLAGTTGYLILNRQSSVK